MQAEFNFGQRPCEDDPEDPLSQWRARQKEERRALARSLGLPIGHEAEVWLKGGVRLRGRLDLHEDMLLHAADSAENTKLLVGRTPFLYSEIESCVRV